jgi:hypothetical protein
MEEEEEGNRDLNVGSMSLQWEGEQQQAGLLAYVRAADASWQIWSSPSYNRSRRGPWPPPRPVVGDRQEL